MKSSKYIIPALLLCSTWINAQTVDQNVTVEREYKPVIQDAGKITSVPEITETTVNKTPAFYTEFNLPLSVGQNIHTLAAAELELQRKIYPNDAFVRIGLGTYLNNLLDLGLPIIKKSDMRLDLKVNHLATFSKEAHSKTDATLMFDKYFKNSNIYAGVGAGHEYAKYYGNNYDKAGDVSDFSTFLTRGSAEYLEQNFTRISRTAQTFMLSEIADGPTDNVFWRFNTQVGLRSLPETQGLRYLGELQYKIFSSQNGLTENVINSKANFNTENGKNRLGLDIDLKNMFYKTANSNTVMNSWDSYSVFSMNPYYNFERTTWNIRLGVKSSFSFVHGKPFNPSPDISAEWKVVPRWLSIYTGAGGSYEVNTLDNMFNENRFLYSDLRVKDTYTPISGFFGIKVKPVYNVLLDAYVNYRYINNQYFFTNKEYAVTNPTISDPANEATIFTNQYNVIYSEASLLKIGLRSNFNIRNLLNIQIKGAYNGWKVFDTAMAWNKPKFEADLAADWRITRNLNLSTNVFYESKRAAKIGTTTKYMSSKTDVNIGASYSYLNWFTMFGKVNNIFNNKYEEFFGYEVQGLNVMVGAAFSF